MILSETITWSSFLCDLNFINTRKKKNQSIVITKLEKRRRDTNMTVNAAVRREFVYTAVLLGMVPNSQNDVQVTSPHVTESEIRDNTFPSGQPALGCTLPILYHIPTNTGRKDEIPYYLGFIGVPVVVIVVVCATSTAPVVRHDQQQQQDLVVDIVQRRHGTTTTQIFHGALQENFGTA